MDLKYPLQAMNRQFELCICSLGCPKTALEVKQAGTSADSDVHTFFQ